MTNSKSTPWHPGLVDRRSEPEKTEPDAGLAATRPMRWSWRIGAIAGVPIYVHATFTLLLVWVALSHLVRGQGIGAISSGLLLVLSVFACVVLHELSHALMARRFGIRTRDITLLPIGGVASLEKMPEKPSQELQVAVAGPVVSLAIALALFGVLAVLNGPTSLEGLHLVGGPFLTKLMWINLMLAGFNLLPAFPMDGGRVLRAALAMRMDRNRATELAARIGQGMALLFGALGLFYSPFLVIIAVFVWMGARGEASLVQLKSALSGLTVSQAMITEFRVLAPDDSLARAVELTLAGFQQNFPVMDGSRLAGVLTHANVLKGLADRGKDEVARAVMERQFEIAEPQEMLEGAFERLQHCRCRALVVARNGRVVGLLTPESIGEMLTMESALRTSHAHGAPARER